MKDHAVLFVQCANEVAHLRPQRAFHRPRFRPDHMDFDIPRAQRRGGFEGDETGADHDGAAGALRQFDDGTAIAQRAQHMDVGLIGSRDRQPHRLGAGRQQQAIIGNAGAVGDQHLARLGIDGGHFGIQTQVDFGLRIKAVRTQRQPILRRAAGEIVLRQVGTVDRCCGFAAQHDDAAAELLPPQHLRRGESRRTPADDDDCSGRIEEALAARLRLVALLPDHDAIALLLDLPHRKRAQRRRARRFPGAQIEAGVMPGTADAVADHKAFRQRPMVVTAMGVDGENLGSRAHQQNILVTDVPEQGPAGERAWRDALGEIGAGGCGLLISHDDLPSAVFVSGVLSVQSWCLQKLGAVG
jgi:hypothetical protein